MRSKKISRKLTLEDPIEIHRRRWLGETQHVLAAAFGVNPRRISEVFAGKIFPEARELALKC
jgi:hypothetical protein